MISQTRSHESECKWMLKKQHTTFYEMINQEVADELYLPYTQDTTIVDKAFIIKAKINECRGSATYINEIHCQDTDMIFKPGEQKLLLVKDYENSALTEDDTRLPGSNIDGIIENTTVDGHIGLVEVSGSPNNHTDNFSHYKGDRIKLAKNLKSLFKVVISMKVYIYSLSMPMWDVFVFKLETKFYIPVRPTLFPSTIPTFISKLFELGELLNHFTNEQRNFLSTNDYSSSSSSDSDKSVFSNPKISPKKRKHHQR
ncbi:hypothetical protein BDC45DRAFT_531022 [Circinella umbellata]|nr:hypothetical protein BDC45DRAFT_531022 [Circinella umbellata]